MNKKIAMTAVLLLSAPCAKAADKTAPKVSAQQAAAAEDDVTPLLARDPSALVIGPEKSAADALAISLPPNAPFMCAREGKPKIKIADEDALHARYRAVSIPIDESQLLGVKVGDRVDVLAVFSVSSSTGAKRTLSETMLQDVEVLGVATTGSLFGRGVITLELNPIEAQYAALGSRQAALYIARRAPGDAAIHPMEMSSFGAFFW